MTIRAGMGMAALMGLLLLMSCTGDGELYAPEVARMTADAVQARVGTDGFHVIDARYGRDWTGSDRKIAGAVREDPHEISSWAGSYSRTDTIVVYCG